MADVDVPAALLRAAGLRPPPDEVAEISAFYTSLREQVDRLYDVEVLDFGPAPVFDPRDGAM